MCLVLFAINEHPQYPLIVAANRDEFYRRPTAAAKFWDDAPHILAGRDLERGGTWLGIAKDGRWAAVTTFREMPRIAYGTSRGHLVSDYLDTARSPRDYAERVRGRGDLYAGFNLLVGDLGHAVYCSNREAGLREINQGVHGLSNHLLNTAWPKLVRARRRFARVLKDPEEIHPGRAFEILGSREIPDDGDLPDTGVGLELERLLSSAFIAGPDYGTRCSTVLLVDAGGGVTFIERSYRPDAAGRYHPGHFRDEIHRFQVEPRPVLAKDFG